MSENKELLDVIDEMLEKLDNSEENSADFKKELDEKLNSVACNKGFQDYNEMLQKQIQGNSDILAFIEEAIKDIEYSPRQQGSYKEGHQEALYKYFEMAKTADLNVIKDKCRSEEKSITALSTLRDDRLKGYKDGLYLFNIISDDALNQGK